MKKLILAASLLFCTAATMTSCNNGDYDADPTTNNSGIAIPDITADNNNNKFNWTGTAPLSVKVDGKAFQATTGSITASNGTLTIYAAAGVEASVTFSIPDIIPVGGTYIFTTGNSAQYTENVTDIYNTALAGSGAVRITENDNSHVAGLFYFNAKGTTGKVKALTQGYFSIQR